MSVVAEICVAAQIAELIERAVRASQELRGMAHDSIDREIKQWEEMLRGIEIVLLDAEKQQSKRDGVRIWLQELQHLAFDVEDILEDFDYEFIRRQTNPAVDYWPKVAFDSWKFSRKMAARTNKITSRFSKLTNLKEQLNLLERGESSERPVDRSWSIPPFEPMLFGRKEEESALIEAVFDPQTEVIPILGMGGIGKTTLARKVFEGANVKEAFDTRAWVSVSQDYNIEKILNGLLEDITNQPSSHSNMNTLQRRLSEALEGKMSLIVLDDLWNDREADWRVLKLTLATGLVGSKIIVTTRKESVANVVKTSDLSVSLRPMQDELCWALFCSRAGVDPREIVGSDKERIGREVVRRCGGLPLAVAIMGGVFANTDDSERWRDLKSDTDCDVMSVIRCSYNDLSSKLKRCFSIFAMYPEDYQFKEDKLVRIWLGTGLIQWDEIKCYEFGLSHRYFEEFKRRSLLLQDGKMHDLVRKIASEVSGDHCCTLIGRKVEETVYESGRTRHLYLYGDESFESLVKGAKGSVLRTIQIEGLSVDASLSGLNDVFSNFRFLRTLILNRWPSELPQSIGKLVHLRNLDFRFSRFRYLPCSLTHLRKMENLNLKFCVDLEALPDDIGNLKNLKLLDLTMCKKIVELPESIGWLSSLKALQLIDCKSLESIPCSIGNLQNLKRLDLYGCERIVHLPDSVSSLRNLEILNLKLCMNLSMIPNDIGNLMNLRFLDLSKCGNIAELPDSIGCISSLNTLNLSDCKSLVKIPSSVKNMQNLTRLDVSKCVNIVEIPEIIKCENLVKVPISLHNLKKLRSLDYRCCNKLEESSLTVLKKRRIIREHE